MYPLDVFFPLRSFFFLPFLAGQISGYPFYLLLQILPPLSFPGQAHLLVSEGKYASLQLPCMPSNRKGGPLVHQDAIGTCLIHPSFYPTREDFFIKTCGTAFRRRLGRERNFPPNAVHGP